MALTLSHQTALDVIRTLRSQGDNLHQMDTTPFSSPVAPIGQRWNAQNFNSDVWQWPMPSQLHPLHVLVPADRGRMRGLMIKEHTTRRDLPAGSILWLDERASVVCPELLFLQMAESFSLPALVMLGNELCGHFSRFATEPLAGDVVDGIPTATSAESLKSYLCHFGGRRGVANAREALRYICDHAVSAPEALLATIYALPHTESGYGFGPVRLNDRVHVDDDGSWVRVKSRYPDLTFGFAPVGINYDGSKHFDLGKLMLSADAFARADAQSQGKARETLKQELVKVRAKVLDDNLRNRQLAAQGQIIFPVTKEDVADGRHLDALSRQVLSCAHRVFGVNVSKYLKPLDDTSLTRDRWELLSTLLPNGGFGRSSYGRM
ncbi:MAG: hypothetical protein Q4A01_03305 [Coriobacteriales bacterium]|nr:hypothetical protein [Coriobacteriales bacterium]